WRRSAAWRRRWSRTGVATAWSLRVMLKLRQRLRSPTVAFTSMYQAAQTDTTTPL
ncbi:peroxisomal membrane protein 11C isoform 2, partial [Daubentonia madagascariensis]